MTTRLVRVDWEGTGRDTCGGRVSTWAGAIRLILGRIVPELPAELDRSLRTRSREICTELVSSRNEVA